MAKRVVLLNVHNLADRAALVWVILMLCMCADVICVVDMDYCGGRGVEHRAGGQVNTWVEWGKYLCKIYTLVRSYDT